jgi:hypothetical protein
MGPYVCPYGPNVGPYETHMGPYETHVGLMWACVGPRVPYDTHVRP